MAGPGGGALKAKRPRNAGRKRHRLWLLAALVAVVVVGTAVTLVITHWSFSEKALVKDLQQVSSSPVEIKSFRTRYFPSPGCVAENVTFRGSDPSSPPLLEIRSVTIRSTFAGLLARRVAEIRADGLRLRVPRSGLKPKTGLGSVTIGRIVINDGIVEFEPHRKDAEPVRFNIYHSAFIPHEGFDRLDFSARLKIPEPPAEVAVNGSVGPWKKGQPGQTPLEGTYTLERGMLGAFRGVAGTLSSQGKFSGVLERIKVHGGTDMRDFQLKDPGHPVTFGTSFSAEVDGKNGNTFLDAVQAQLRRTSLNVQGSVAPSPESQKESGRKLTSDRTSSTGARGKTANLAIDGKGRIEDLLWLFTEAKPPRMLGALTLKAKVSVPPGPVEFIRKISLRGNFEISSASFTNPSTQHALEDLSAGVKANHEVSDTAQVVADLKGYVTLQNGIARFSNLSMTIPGASAEFAGIYSFVTEKIDLRGTLRTEKPLSQATTGVKSALLKIIGHFFKRKRDFVVPVRIGGTYRNPTFRFAMGANE